VIVAKSYVGFEFLHSEISTKIIIGLIIIIIIIIITVGLTLVSPSIRQYQECPRDLKQQFFFFSSD
jgi:hypothetical protein